MSDNSTWPHPLIDPEDPCQDRRCTRVDGRCVSMHCVHCGQSCGIYGHVACQDRARAVREDTTRADTGTETP